MLGTMRAHLLATILLSLASIAHSYGDDEVTRVFVFAGQSNMVGSDSRVSDIERFPPFSGLGSPQEGVRFSYVLGRENKTRSNGWTILQPVNGIVGPELSFAREVRRHVDAPLAIIKCAAGGTHLGGDWNPVEPIGFKMYPLLLEQVRGALAELEQEGIPYRLEGFVWHQGENDMFEASYMPAYGQNLAGFVSAVRRDLEAPALRFYVGELCTKTIWGMDLRPRMYAIRNGQTAVASADPLVDYIPTSHVGVEIGRPVGLHYHYGTLGQLEHGANYAEAYLRNIGLGPEPSPGLETWPHGDGETVRLFVLAGHRNMEGERAFIQELEAMPDDSGLLEPFQNIPYRYEVGGGFRISNGWEALAPRGPYDTFGPELSMAAELNKEGGSPMAIAKFTHSGSQIIDWTPDGSEAEARNLYPSFIRFVKESVEALESTGNEVELAGIFYHLGENDMSFHPYRRDASRRLSEIIEQSRKDLGQPELSWFVSQQAPTDHESVNGIDVVEEVAELAAADPRLHHILALDPPPQDRAIVLDTAGILWLGRQMAGAYLATR